MQTGSKTRAPSGWPPVTQGSPLVSQNALGAVRQRRNRVSERFNRQPFSPLPILRTLIRF
jgi:hypothetical protein